jgi:hypothetical protein
MIYHSLCHIIIIMASTVSKIQTRFLRQRFMKELYATSGVLHKLLALADTVKFDRTNEAYLLKQLNSGFAALTKLMRDKEVIKAVDKLLKKYYRYCPNNEEVCPRLDPRKFMCSLVMKGYPEFILGNSSYDADVYKLSCKMLDCLMELMATKPVTKAMMTKFNKSLSMYTNAFNLHLYVDKCRKIDELAKQWYDLEKTKSEVTTSKSYDEKDKAEVLTRLENSSNKIVQMFYVIDKNFNKEYLANYKKLADKLHDSIVNSYWDVLCEQLNNNQFDMLFKLVGEIRDQLIMLRANNPKYKEDLCEYLDLEFIKDKIENKLMTPVEFLKYGDYMVSKVAEITAASKEKLLLDQWKEIKNAAYAGKITKFDQLVSIVLKFVLDSIQSIKDDIYGFALMKDLFGRKKAI